MMKRLAIVLLMAAITGLWACKKSGDDGGVKVIVGDNNGGTNTGGTDAGGTNTNPIVYNRTLIGYGTNGAAPANGGYFDITGDGKTNILASAAKGGFSVNGSRANSSTFYGSGEQPYKDVNFNIDTNFVVEVLDTTLYRVCSMYPFAKSFPLANYDQATFKLPAASYKKFVTFAYFSFFTYAPADKCIPNGFTENPYYNGAYFIFRIRNKRTNKSRYGWGNISAGGGDNFVNQVGFRELAYSTKEEVLLAPGYH